VRKIVQISRHVDCTTRAVMLDQLRSLLQPRPLVGTIFGTAVPLDVPELARERIGVVASRGPVIVGVRRAFEEARLVPAIITAAGASVLFALPWACGLSAEEIGRFWLVRSPREYLDFDWRGRIRGEALEREFTWWLGGRRLGDTPIAFSTRAWSSWATPEVPVAEVARRVFESCYGRFLSRRTWRRKMIAGRTEARTALLRRDSMAHRAAA
jgi:hypothetical protein